MKMNKTISKRLLGMSLGGLALTGLAHANQARVSAAAALIRIAQPMRELQNVLRIAV
jgi:hypothetical protein